MVKYEKVQNICTKGNEDMRVTSALKRIVVVLVACCLWIIGCLMLTGQLSPVYAGAHGSPKKDGDVGSIQVHNKTTYYDDVDDLLDDLEEYDECEIIVDMFKDWKMDDDCQRIEIASGSKSHKTEVFFDMHGYTIERDITNYGSDYLVFAIGEYVDMEIYGGSHEGSKTEMKSFTGFGMETKPFDSNLYFGTTHYYKGAGIIGGAFNASIFDWWGIYPKGGGAIYLSSNSHLELIDVTIGGSKSRDGEGGGLYIDDDSTVNMYGSTIEGCLTDNDGGGGVYLADDSKLYMFQSSICQNGTYENGGGVLVGGENSLVDLSGGSKIDGNVSFKEGGGIAVANDDNVIKGDADGTSYICNNQVSSLEQSAPLWGRSNGGGVLFENPGTIRNLNITGNVNHYGDGGGIYVESDSLTSNTYLVENCNFRNNKASRPDYGDADWGNGGAIYLGDNEAVVRNCTFDGNSGYRKGGAIYIESDDVKINDCTFNKNEAMKSRGNTQSLEQKGGAAYVYGHNAEFNNCSFTSNCAISAGAIYVEDNTATDNHVKFTGETVIKDNVVENQNDSRVQYKDKPDSNLYLNNKSHAYFVSLQKGSRVYLGADNDVISTYDKATNEDQVKYLTLQSDESSPKILKYDYNESNDTSLKVVPATKAECTVHITDTEGNLDDYVKVNQGFPIDEPEKQTIEGRAFFGWFPLDDEGNVCEDEWDFNRSVYEDMTLCGVWDDGVRVILKDSIDDDKEKILSAKKGEYTLPSYPFVTTDERYDHKYFVGWRMDSDADILEPNDKVNLKDLEHIFTAEWEDIPETVTVGLNKNDGSEERTTIGVPTSSPFQLPECEFTVLPDETYRFEFIGWSFEPNGDIIDYEYMNPMLIKNMELYANWEKVEKDEPNYEVPADLTANCGQLLRSIDLPEGFTWVDRSARIGGIDDNVFYVNYMPEDFDRYKAVENIEVSISVEHNYKETLLEPTCTKPGYRIIICKECGDSHTEITDEPLPHKWIYEDFGDGQQNTCERCGAVEVIFDNPGAEHSFADEYTVDKPATFDHDGSKSKHCQDEDCRAVSDRLVIPALSHIELDAKGLMYNGEEQKPEVKVISRDSDTELKPGQDYDLTYSEDSTNAGEKTVTVTFMGEYEGEATENYEIHGMPIAGKPLALSEKYIKYTGSAIEPEVRVGGLNEGTDYEVEYSDNINVGRATVTVTGIGNYTGTVSKTFTIEPASMTDKTVKLSYTTATYSGKAKTPSVTISGLNKDTDYTVSYSNNTKVGKAKVTITGQGNCEGSTYMTFKITPKKAVVKYVTPGYRKLTVKMSTRVSSTGGSRYQIAYKKAGASKWKYTSTTSQKTVIRRLKKGKKYSIKVRAYKTVNGTTYYGTWSKTRTSRKVK